MNGGLFSVEQIMMQLQQLQRQYQQICEEMMSLHNAVGQIMNQLQQATGRRSVMQPSPSLGFGVGGGNQPYVPGSVYGSPRPVPSSMYQPVGFTPSGLQGSSVVGSLQSVKTTGGVPDGIVGRQSEYASYARLT